MARKPTPPRPTLVLLVRHGQTPTTGSTLPGRAPGLHLAETGQAQAQAAADRIAALKDVAAVYASPLERTRETAAPIAAARGPEGPDRAVACSSATSATGPAPSSRTSGSPEWQTVQRYPSGFRFPDGESFTEMQTRIVGALDQLVARHPGETIVAVSHADPIKAAVAHALGTHLDLFQRIVVSPCSVSAILYGATGPAVLAVNSTGDDLSRLGLS